jgi:hypothetical protein
MRPKPRSTLVVSRTGCMNILRWRCYSNAGTPPQTTLPPWTAGSTACTMPFGRRAGSYRPRLWVVSIRRACPVRSVRVTVFELSGRRRSTIFLTAWTTSEVGRNVSLLLIPLLVLRMTGSASLTAAVAALEATPTLLLGLVAGAAADRYRAGFVLIASDVCCAIAMMTAAILALTGAIQLWMLIAAAAVSAVGVVFRDAGTFRALRQIAEGRQAVRLASGTQTLGAVAAILGPFAAGWLVRTDLAWAAGWPRPHCTPGSAGSSDAGVRPARTGNPGVPRSRREPEP